MSTTNSPKISIGITNYNGIDVLRECLQNLESLRVQLPENYFEVFIVDNASADGSPEMIVHDFSWVRLLKNSDNLGLAVSGNQILKNTTGKYILHLGSDAFPSREVLEGLYEYMENQPKVGLATAKLILRNGKIDLDCHRGFPTPLASATHFTKLNKLFPKSRYFNKYFMGWQNLDEPHEIDLCISHFMFARRQALEDINGWDEDYFIYGEDVDLCYRMKQAGWKIMYLPQFQVTHLKGVTVGVRKETADITRVSDSTKKRVKLESALAMRLFYDKHLAKEYSPLTNSLMYYTMDLMKWWRTRKI